MTRRPAALLLALALGTAVYAAAPADGSWVGEPVRQCATSTRWVHVPAGTVLMGEDGPGRPGKPVHVPEFWIGDHEVTNGEFARFIAATGYVTQAEREGGSALFSPPLSGQDIGGPISWWRFARGADWQHPQGPGSDITGRSWLPVVHVTFEDARAFAAWQASELPDAVQWERAARADQTGPRDPLDWAYDRASGSAPIANTWQGVFPAVDTGQDHFRGIAPVGCFPPNNLGIHDMIGNVWEWTTSSAGSDDGIRRLLKGGSYLCALNYCANFRAAAFQAQDHDLGASHIGFRTIRTTRPGNASPENPS
ncbi:SUMF1/EgtB/PvdO family nonheme iron enzyme [Sphingobium sp. Sx8-8]|uniref:SUMF1/EgtB/PvdO family nonheme iron enzyme n=1 Tax=Sphingobium sp. Sx8-8 TaxID=2933617 RepID=UPI001F574C6D|nr:SUMF1/EgtB/PvdO family nonheme iron enzyme [Sphingobium sp. Sx8-8]